MPILARSMMFCYFLHFLRAVPTAFIGISKILTVTFEIHSFFLLVRNVLLSSNTNLFPGKFNLWYNLKDVSAVLL